MLTHQSAQEETLPPLTEVPATMDERATVTWTFTRANVCKDREKQQTHRRALPSHHQGVPHVSNLKVLSHEQVEGGTRPGADVRHGRAAVSQEPGTQICTLLGLLEENKLRELVHNGALCGEDVPHDLCGLVATHQVQ